MSDPARSPCPHCGEPVAAAARICPHCQRDVRVDLWVEQGPEAERAAYAAARDVEALVPGTRFLDVKRALDAGSGRVAAGVTREQAEEVAEVLGAHGAVLLMQPHGKPPAAAARQPVAWGRVAALAAATVALAAVVWLLTRPGDEPRERAADAAPRAATADLSPRAIGALAAASTASLRCGDSLGSGFFVAPDLLVTNAHVLCGDQPVEVVLGDGRTLTGSVDRVEEELDLATVGVEDAGAPPLPLGDASPLAQGDQVYFYGSPRGLDFTLSQAMVSHATRTLRGVAYLQIDGNVNPGNSGGPLLDRQGRVVGIVTAMIGEASGLGLALPVNYLYAGEQALLEAPAGSDARAWRQLLARVGEDEQREVAEARELLERPALTSVYVDAAASRVTAIVARRAEFEPAGELLQFTVERAGEAVCEPSGTADTWHATDAEALLDPQLARWLARHGLEGDVWVSQVALDWPDCPVPGVEPDLALVLRGGVAGADRVELPAGPLARSF